MARPGVPDFKIPSFSVEHFVSTCSETMDWSLTAFGIPELWQHATGKGIKVAVLDTGCAMLHPDLKEQICAHKDFTKSPVGPGDSNGHGTHCCGVIAAKKNGVGIVGVAPDACLIVGKVLSDSGGGSTKNIVAGIKWAVSQKADIISMSFGSPSSCPDIEAALKYAASKGVILIAAAGNEGPDPETVGYPARYETVLSVAAVDSNNRIAKFSSRGPQVDVAAPGVDILSAYPPKNYAKLSGTSMATPFVAGVAALALEYDRKKKSRSLKSSRDFIEAVKASATDAGTNGFDNDYGWGLLNPKRLVLKEPKVALVKKKNCTQVVIEEKDFVSASKLKFRQLFGEGSRVIVELAMDINAKPGKHA
jgi:subtilisin